MIGPTVRSPLCVATWTVAFNLPQRRRDLSQPSSQRIPRRLVLSARHAVTDMAYFAARDTSPAAYCIDMVAQSDV